MRTSSIRSPARSRAPTVAEVLERATRRAERASAGASSAIEAHAPIVSVSWSGVIDGRVIAVDGSSVLDALRAVEGADELRYLAAEELRAPALIHVEVVSTLRALTRHGRLSAGGGGLLGRLARAGGHAARVEVR